MNNKGFMMAEVVVVSAIVLVVLTGLYASYNKIYSLYNTRIDYYDVNTLYRLDKIRGNYLTSTDTNYMFIDAKVVGLEYNSNELVYLVNKEVFLDSIKFNEFMNNLKDDVNHDVNQTYKDYINFLFDSLDIDTDYVLIMETCSLTDNNDCKYGYLEVYNET